MKTVISAPKMDPQNGRIWPPRGGHFGGPRGHFRAWWPDPGSWRARTPDLATRPQNGPPAYFLSRSILSLAPHRILRAVSCGSDSHEIRSSCTIPPDMLPGIVEFYSVREHKSSVWASSVLLIVQGYRSSRANRVAASVVVGAGVFNSLTMIYKIRNTQNVWSEF